MPREIKNVAASVRQQLLNRAHAMNRPFNELLQHFAMERFLYRLAKSPHVDRFVLKGALMMLVWKVPVSRPTMDIDLLGYVDNDIGTLVDICKAVCGQPVETDDGMDFDPATVEGGRIAEDAEYHGVRVRFRANLGTARVLMQLDIGFGDQVVPRPEVAEYPTLLSLPAPRVRGYTRDSVVAEKLHAMVKRGLLNSRMRDFFDIWLLSCQFAFDGAVLAEAIHTTFQRRDNVIPAEPVALTTEFARGELKRKQWQAFVRKSRIDGVPADFAEVVRCVSGFLKPVVEALAAGRAFDSSWVAPGPWGPRVVE